MRYETKERVLMQIENGVLLKALNSDIVNGTLKVPDSVTSIGELHSSAVQIYSLL